MVPGRFALPVGNGFYYNSLQHSVCHEEELEAHCLLAGQEEQAIHQRLFGLGRFHLLLIPSFECNLRCPHCYVGHLLAKPSGDRVGSTDPRQLLSFIQRAEGKLGPLNNLSIVGGEPLLHVDAFREYLDAGLPVCTTTNGTFNFDDVKDILGRLLHITFSIDGWPEHHNRIRKSLNAGIDPFCVTYRNLCKTIEAFPYLDISVQGSIIDDEEYNLENYSENYFRYFTLMLAAGVKRSKISLGPCAATLRRDATASYRSRIASLMRQSPCCDHLLHKGFYIFNNHIYGSYYRFEEFPPIARLDDSIEDILARKKDFILDTMPMLQDDICMKECKAVGICWGMCTSHRHLFVDNKPSSVCDRRLKEAKLVEIAQRERR